MDTKSYNIRVPKRWARLTLIVGVTALIVAPLTAVATHTFNDVPDTHTFHENIEWLEASGVTRGCNPPANTLFCPDDNVTRGQMAAFMERFAEYLGAEDGTPAQADNATTADHATTADNADMLDGYDASGLITVTANGNGTSNPVTTPETIASANLIVPTDCSLVASGTTDWDGDGSAAILFAWFEVDGTSISTEFADQSTAENDSLSVIANANIAAGSHTVALRARTVGGGTVEDSAMFAMCSPFDSSGDPVVAGNLGSVQNADSDPDDPTS